MTTDETQVIYFKLTAVRRLDLNDKTMSGKDKTRKDCLSLTVVKQGISMNCRRQTLSSDAKAHATRWKTNTVSSAASLTQDTPSSFVWMFRTLTAGCMVHRHVSSFAFSCPWLGVWANVENYNTGCFIQKDPVSLVCLERRCEMNRWQHCRILISLSHTCCAFTMVAKISSFTLYLPYWHRTARLGSL